MTSEEVAAAGYRLLEAPRHVFVFVALASVWHPAGRVDLVERRSGWPEASFLYGRSWRQNPDSFDLDPINLRMSGDHGALYASPIFGVLLDAGPDNWGRRLLDERFQRAHQQELAKTDRTSSRARLPNEIDRLLLAGDDRVGALAFGLTSDRPLVNPADVALSSLAEFESAMIRFDDGEPVPPSIQRLAVGTSLGGARPKATIRDEHGTQWIAKFRRTSDTFDVIRAEYAAMTLAAKAGVDVAVTRIVSLGAREALLVRRFDRDQASGVLGRFPYLSALSLLGLHETSMAGSYAQIADRMRKMGCPAEDLRQLFRRMAFNVAIGNTDDHLRNHAMIRLDGRWRLSPAFDVLPCPDGPPSQAIDVGVIGTDPTTANVVSHHARFGVTRDDADAIIQDVVAVTEGWRDHFSAAGVPGASIRRIERCVGRLTRI